MRNYFIGFLSAIIPVLFVCSACSEDEDPGHLGDPIGPISAKDFDAVPVPTYGTVVEAYENIKAHSPTLLDKESDDLKLALFKEVEDLSNSSPNETELSSLLDKLSREEWILVVENSYKAYLVFSIVRTAFLEPQNSFSCDPGLSLIDTKIDALRHAYWNALMVQKTDAEFAEKLATAHQDNSNSDATKMDLHNDKMGRELVKKYPSAKAGELLTLLLQYDYLFVENGDFTLSSYIGLVYLKGKKKYDVKMKGSLTNPDSGGPWDIEFDIYECGETVRGNFVIVRGASKQERRFSGIVNQDGSIQLEVSNPFVFENPTGMYACVGMKMVLTGDENKLEGKWTSSNCIRGGVVNMSKDG